MTKDGDIYAFNEATSVLEKADNILWHVVIVKNILWLLMLIICIERFAA
jgi:hypothetical protein